MADDAEMKLLGWLNQREQEHLDKAIMTRSEGPVSAEHTAEAYRFHQAAAFVLKTLAARGDDPIEDTGKGGTNA